MELVLSSVLFKAVNWEYRYNNVLHSDFGLIIY